MDCKELVQIRSNISFSKEEKYKMKCKPSKKLDGKMLEN
jgi:hypothetical protein